MGVWRSGVGMRVRLWEVQERAEEAWFLEEMGLRRFRLVLAFAKFYWVLQLQLEWWLLSHRRIWAMAAAVTSRMSIMQKEHMQLIIIPMKNMSTTMIMNNSVVTSITITGQRSWIKYRDWCKGYPK
jgi:hypothetical protein